jgi:hypothetical protein
MEKIMLFRLTITVLMAGVLTWDLLNRLWMPQTPLLHRDVLMTGALLWLITCFMPQSNDNDWADLV